MNKKYKIFVSGLFAFIIVILCITVISFLLKDNDNYSSFIGSVMGAIISGFITFVALFITIKQGNENQEKALHMQSALQVENNMLHLLENQKEIITESINRLDNLLFTVQILKVSGVEELLVERKNLIDIFSDYREAMNVIKLNTDIYIDTSKCDGCADCDIKSYGELSKRKTKLCECFNKVEYNCNLMVQELQTALDKCIDTQNLLTQRSSYRESMILREEQIQNYKRYSTINSNDNETIEKLKQYEAECAKIQDQIKTIDEQIQSAFIEIDEKNRKARSKANNIQMCDRSELYNAVMRYFDVYNFYIKENKKFIMNNGTLSNNICKKYALD